MAFVNSYKDLDVYQLSRKLAKKIFEISSRFPKHETYSLTDQIRRPSRSIGAQIAESWAKRRYERQFISKLTAADGEQFETQHWIEVAYDSNLITFKEMITIIQDGNSINKMLDAMVYKSSQFYKRNSLH